MDDDNFWSEIVANTRSNSAVEGFELLKSYIASGQASDRALWGMFSACRALSQACQDQINERRQARRRAA